MDFWQSAIGLIGAVFGAGTTYGLTQGRLTRVEEDLKDHKRNTDGQLEKIDAKLDNITEHIIRIVGKIK